jgi:hypothetical protein
MNSRARLFGIALIAISTLFILSCGGTMTKGENWLASKTDKPEVNVSGKWSSPEWGEASLQQEGNRITGMLGDYPVKGVVSGKVLYLMMYSGDRVHYFAELTVTDENTLNGLYSSKYATIDESKKAPPLTRAMSLIKVTP